MIKKKLHILERIPIAFILSIALLFSIIGIATALHYFTHNLANTIPALLPPYSDTFILLIIKSIAIGFVGPCIGIVLISIKAQNHISSINSILKSSLSERKIDTNFQHFYHAKTLGSAIANTQALLMLYRSFDNMKSNRISADSATIKVILDHITEGIVIVNKEKVVTHINHPAEQILKLLPGDIIGQIISRQVSHPDLIGAIDMAISQDIKTREKTIKFSDEKLITVNIYPVTNKLSEVTRAILILAVKKRRPLTAASPNL
jgi:transcriptional regulator with PAS, ATPase and Fis domain